MRIADGTSTRPPFPPFLSLLSPRWPHHAPHPASVHLASNQRVLGQGAQVTGLAPKVWVYLLRRAAPLQPPRRLLLLQGGRREGGLFWGGGSRGGDVSIML